MSETCLKVASSADDLPPVVLSTDRATPIPAALLRVPSGDTRDDTSEPSPRKIRSLDPTSSPSSPSPSPRAGARARIDTTKTLGSLSSAGTKTSRSSSHPVLLSTRRMDPNTGAVESVEETEVSLTRKEEVEKCIGLGLRVLKACLLQRYIVPPDYRRASESLKALKAFVLSLLVCGNSESEPRWKLRWDILVGILIIYRQTSLRPVLLFSPFRRCGPAEGHRQ
ncbi:unnamed protein product [Symbiodinium sp. CCMP2592]|nr:unnamed protein product [Symbiodinium sp. CCMP2592]